MTKMIFIWHERAYFTVFDWFDCLSTLKWYFPQPMWDSYTRLDLIQNITIIACYFTFQKLLTPVSIFITEDNQDIIAVNTTYKYTTYQIICANNITIDSTLANIITTKIAYCPMTVTFCHFACVLKDWLKWFCSLFFLCVCILILILNTRTAIHLKRPSETLEASVCLFCSCLPVTAAL